MWRGMAYKMHEAARKNMEIMPLLCRCENAMWQGVAHKTREAARKSREIRPSLHVSEGTMCQIKRRLSGNPIRHEPALRHSHPVFSKPSASSVRLYAEKLPILCASE